MSQWTAKPSAWRATPWMNPVENWNHPLRAEQHRSPRVDRIHKRDRGAEWRKRSKRAQDCRLHIGGVWAAMSVRIQLGACISTRHDNKLSFFFFAVMLLIIFRFLNFLSVSRLDPIRDHSSMRSQRGSWGIELTAGVEVRRGKEEGRSRRAVEALGRSRAA